MRVRRVSIVTLLVAISGSGTALAGDGSVTVVRVDPNDPTSAIAKLSVKTTVYVDSPRTAEQFDLMKEQLQGFAKSMCDISDGLVSIDQIDFVNHPAETAAADIAWWQRPGRAVNGGGFGTPAGASCDPSEPADVSPGGLFYLYGTNYNPDAPQWSDFPVAATLAHEMSHSIFGLGDSYADIRGGDYGYPRGAGFTGRRSMSFGPDAGEFFVDPVYGSVLVDRMLASEAEPREDGSPLYTGNVFAPDGTNQWWLQNNSIMQVATGQVCRDSSGLSPGDYNPTWVNQACLRNEDCSPYFTGPPDADGNPTPAGTDFAYCPTSGLATSSELSVYGNADRDRFNMTRGEWSPPYPAGTLVPHGQVGRELVFAGFLYPTTDAQPDDLTSNLGDQDLAACQETDANGNCLSTCDRLLDATGVSQIGTAPTIGGSVAVETQCSSEHQAGSALCPGALAPSSPNNPASGTAPNAVCDGCVLANLSACAPAFG